MFIFELCAKTLRLIVLWARKISVISCTNRATNCKFVLFCFDRTLHLGYSIIIFTPLQSRFKMENESFEKALAPQPVKRKRSSLLNPADKRPNRDSRTVSFNDKCIYKELHRDGTFDITNFFISEDMDLTMMDIVEPDIDRDTLNLQNQTIDNSVEMSIEDRSISISRELNETEPLSQISEISSLIVNDFQLASETLYGAFHDSNNLSIRSSGDDTLMRNIEALNDCIQKIDKESEESKRKLDQEIADLFKFYRHVVNKEDKYEFAIAIFGLRHSLWLIIKINPETYPNEKLKLRFAVNKNDRHLYPFAEYSEAVRRYTKEGNYGYLTRFIINAQRFRRFLRKICYQKTN